MNLTDGQLRGLQMVRDLVKSPTPRVAVLAGTAGTGKTSLLKVIAEELGNPIIICPTGKASARVKEATGVAAMTAHRWQYQAVTDPRTGQMSFMRRPPQELAVGEAGVLVIDEASMVDADLWNDIWDNCLILGLKVLCVGDAFQLPPVEEKDSDFSLLNPNNGISSSYVLLDEVLRQAQESPVIRASMAVRAGDIQGALKLLPLVPVGKFVERAARVSSSGGVVICHRNVTRHWANARIREARGMTGSIQPSEPVMVLKNNYQLNVYNGETHVFREWQELTPTRHAIHDRWLDKKETSAFGVATMANAEGETFRAVLAEEALWGRLNSGYSALEATGKILFNDVPFLHGNFGYTYSCHKAQGSEWNEVLVALEPSLRFWGRDKEQSLRWFYTSLTRSRETCYICLGATATN